MKKLIVLVTMLALMVMATAVLAGPPEQSPWVNTGEDCTPASIEAQGGIGGGTLYYNPYSDKTHCFED